MALRYIKHWFLFQILCFLGGLYLSLSEALSSYGELIGSLSEALSKKKNYVLQITGFENFEPKKSHLALTRWLVTSYDLS